MDEQTFIGNMVKRARDQSHRMPYQGVIVTLADALVRAVKQQGHEYNCSASRGMERDCHCGWLEVKEIAKRCAPSAEAESKP